MWNKDQIRTLKQRAYSLGDNEYLRDHISALNMHLNDYERKSFVQEKNKQWREAEHEADIIQEIITSLDGGRQSAA